MKEKASKQTLTIKMLNEMVRYDPATGKLFSNGKSPREIFPDEDGYVSLYHSTLKRKFKMRRDKLSWQLGYQKMLRKDNRVLHKNLNFNDFRLINLQAVPRGVYSKIMEAYRNLSGNLKMIPHPTDQYTYHLHYKLKGLDYIETVYDVVNAKRRMMRLQLKFAKIVNQYCVFDD